MPQTDRVSDDPGVAAGSARLNAPSQSLEKVLALLPALETPTISYLSDERWVAINTIVEERIVTELVPALSEAGARGIVEYPLNKIIE